MADFSEITVFGKKTAADLMKEIHESTRRKEKIIQGTIEELKVYIKNIGDAVQLGPMLAKYMEVLVQSDEHMIKLLAIVTKGIGKGDTMEESKLTDEEKKYLIELSKVIANPSAQA